MKENERNRQKTLSPKQEAALLAVLESDTMEDAAKAAGVSRTALWNWTRDDVFKARLAEARAELFGAALQSLKGSMKTAADVLARLMNSRNENTRRLAAAAVLTLGLKAHEALSVEERLSRLEKAFGDREGNKFSGGLN